MSCTALFSGAAVAGLAWVGAAGLEGAAAKEGIPGATQAAYSQAVTAKSIQHSAVPQPPVGLASDRHLDKTPPRQTKGLDLVKLGWSYDCMECHKLLMARWHFDRPMVEHQSIKLDHGNNRFCLNCHHATNRNAFVDYDGSEIAESNVVLLCAKCHGPTYRDWQAGAHGRRNGHWDTAKGLRTQLRCIQCHDPHQPSFQPMKPLAPLRYPPRAANPPSPGGSHPTHADQPEAKP